MTMQTLPAFRLVRPGTLAEASALLARDPGARILAGGTDLVANLRHGLGTPSTLVDLGALADLAGIEDTADGLLRIGAGATLAQLAAHPRIRAAYAALAQAAAAVAGPALRSAATVGGNLCLDTRCVFYNQSEWWRAASGFCLKHGGDRCHVAPQGKVCRAAYSGDLAPALLALGAEVEIAGAGGTRRTPLAALYADDGAAHLELAPGEILVAVHLAVPVPGLRTGYRKNRARGAIDFPLAGVAAALRLRSGRVDSLRIALTGTNSRPFVLEGTDALTGASPDDALLSAIGKLVQHQARPLRTTATSANYRRQVAVVMAQRLVRELSGA
jgi:4-hydroxybenzoyl-CoA reductase subunit beta